MHSSRMRTVRSSSQGGVREVSAEGVSRGVSAGGRGAVCQAVCLADTPHEQNDRQCKNITLA